jgi:hypothetical protein
MIGWRETIRGLRVIKERRCGCSLATRMAARPGADPRVQRRNQAAALVSPTMSRDGAGSQRIVVIGGRPQPPPGPAPREVHPPRDPRLQREAAAKHGPMQQAGWTTRRLTIAGALGAAASLFGGVMFVSQFGVSGANDSPLLAIGFGLFVIGMVVFCAALIALLGTGISIVTARSGWPAAAGIVVAPLGLAWALHLFGAVGYAVPAVLSLVLISGLVVALK